MEYNCEWLKHHINDIDPPTFPCEWAKRNWHKTASQITEPFPCDNLREKWEGKDNYRTVLYTDGTFIINEKSTDIDANVQAHGAETNVYPPLDADHDYVFPAQSDRYWVGEVEQIKFAKFGSTVKPTSMRGWYMYCVNLESFDATNLDTSDCTSLRFLFAGDNRRQLTKLKTLDLSSLDTSKVEDMAQLCNRCVALESIDLSLFNTSNVTDMREMFKNCSALESVDLSSFSTLNATNMDGMFNACSALASVSLSSFNTSNVTNMWGMFKGCSALASIDVSSFNTSNVTNMAEMFQNCLALTTIYASTSFDTSNASNSTGMFRGDTNLVGGAGTTYDDTKVDKTYARIDSPPDALGYFTEK